MTPSHTTIVEQPRERSRLRRKLGREFYTLKRKAEWRFSRQKWAKERVGESLPFKWKEHRSFLLRPLRDVDMWLQHNKVTNLRLAINQIDGLLIRPGETFSLWKLVGRPTEKKGYLTGLVLDNGKVSQGIGGGLCQLGNLLYWIALHTPLVVKERWRHSYDVFPDVNRTLPFGSGATLAYNYVDLQLFNPTSQTFQINLRLSDTHLHGLISSDLPSHYDYEIFETDHAFRHQWWGGYTRHNRIWRRVTERETGEERVELVTENHAIMMYEPMLPESSVSG
ncbi:MAG: VanW family protein [Candidatus Kapaibacterium sp.]